MLALDRWTPTAPMGERRAGHHATLLLEGRVLLGGGCPDARCSVFSRSTEFFEPSTMRFISGPDMLQARLGARAMRLPDGTVMINQGCSGRAECDLTNERFDPSTRTFSMMDPAVTPRAFHELVMHTAARQVISIAGCTPGSVTWWVESFDLSGIPDAHTADATVDAARDAAPDVPARDVASDEPGMPDAPPADAAGATDTGNVSRRAPACGCRIAGADPQRAFARSASQWLAINLCMLGLCRSKRRRPPSKAPS